tara:strand:+ start:4992 stop:5096 length:105 start_codon:yes stop_codon:yes gene_type:complete
MRGRFGVIATQRGEFDKNQFEIKLTSKAKHEFEI